MGLIDQRLDEIDQRLKKIERKLDLILREEKKKNNDPMSDWITEKEATEKLHWSSQWLRKLIKNGSIPVRQKSIHGRNFQYYKPDIDRLLTATYQ